MRSQRSCLTPRQVSPEQQERIARQGVLIAVIDLHPVQATVSELVRLLAFSPEDWYERDGIEQAVIDLAGVGLLHKHDFLNRPDSLVTPTQAALVANEVLMDEYDGEGD